MSFILIYSKAFNYCYFNLSFGLPSPCLSLQSSKTKKLPPSQIHCDPSRWQLIIPTGLYCPSPWPSSGITLPCLQEPPQLRLVPLGPPLGSGHQVVPPWSSLWWTSWSYLYPWWSSSFASLLADRFLMSQCGRPRPVCP